ncbi:MAG: hypothetical protein IKJ09_00790 [Bacteroidaceae bacterium]|nr:hypothetical protein [Bacteroidaceae bacterium]
MYRLLSWFPQQHNGCAGASFGIALTPEWLDAVNKSKLNQSAVNKLIDSIGNDILRGHGFDPVDEEEIHFRIRVGWGDWGPEHITVPGNACGLDIVHSPVGGFPGEIHLLPHNVDSLAQASMILTVFVKIAEILEYECLERNCYGI